MARKEEMAALNVRVPRSLAKGLDLMVAKLDYRHGVSVTKTDVIREMLAKLLRGEIDLECFGGVSAKEIAPE